MRMLLDEMVPRRAAVLLRTDHGHDAVHVSEVGLAATEDSAVAAFARAGDRALVTENVVDYAAGRDIVLICVLKRNLPSGTAQAPALATLLHGWAKDNPDPYRGHHWPR